MNLLNKIKSTYNTKIFSSMIESQEYSKLRNNLLDLKSKNKSEYLNMAHLVLNNSIQNQSINEIANIKVQKTVWKGKTVHSKY